MAEDQTYSDSDILVWFSCHRDYFRFRLAELVSIIHIVAQTEVSLESLGLEKDALLQCLEKGSSQAITLGQDNDVFLRVRLPSLHKETFAKEILKRSILVKAVVEPWGSASNYDELKDVLHKTLPPQRFQDHVNDEKSFAFLVHAFGHHLTQKEQISRMANLSFLFSGREKANLKNPFTRLALFEKWWRSSQTAMPQLDRIYFGRFLASRSESQPWWLPYSLTVRPVLGPTTLDNELAFIMANQALIQKGSRVFDPFCGTGGLLIAAAHFGACCLGADIDARVLKGWGVSQKNTNVTHGPETTSDIFRNFKDYNLPQPDIVRADSAYWVRGVTTALKPYADAILTDPPYGIRASIREIPNGQSRKSAFLHATPSKKENGDISPRMSRDYIPPTAVSDVNAVIRDLLDIASRFLVDKGRLVFLLPVQLSCVAAGMKLVDAHPDLCLIATSLQELSAGMGRVLVTMERRKRAP